MNVYITEARTGWGRGMAQLNATRLVVTFVFATAPGSVWLSRWMLPQSWPPRRPPNRRRERTPAGAS